MLSRKLIDENKIPKSRIELHLHLEGSVRVTTIWELCQKKGLKLTPNGTFDEMKSFCQMKRPETLGVCLDIIRDYYQIFRGDSEAIERISYELCEDEFKQGVLYFEVRMSPQLSSNTVKTVDKRALSPTDPKAVSPKQVVESVLKGLKKGENVFGIKSSLILSCICGYPEWSEEVLELVNEFRDKGVVGIDIAGPESTDPLSTHSFTPTDVMTFKKAKELNIHRTCHAGEVGPAVNVAFAVEHMCAERIGHGYSGVEDEQVYEKCVSANIHFESCPYSSYYTGAVSPSIRHPILKLAEDNGNYSINKDDPTVFGSTLDDEYKYLRRMGLNEVHIIRANINALKASFLPESQKNELLKQLYSVYGFNS